MESSQESSSQTLVSKLELVVPGTFVVLQGIPGDGFANTIDSHPILSDDEMDDDDEEEDNTDLDGVVVYEPRTENTVFATSNSNSTLLPPTLTTLSVQPLLSTTSGLKTIPPTREDSFIVVEDEQQQQQQQSVVQPAASNRTLSAREQRAVETWNTKRRRKELEGRKDWLEVQDGSLNPPTQHATEEQRLQNDVIRTYAWMQKTDASPWWLDAQGRLAVMKGLPKRAITGIVLRGGSTIGSLDPGTTVVGTQLVCLDTTTFREIPMEVSIVDGSQVFPQGRPGWLQLLKIVSPSEGWIVYSIDGPSFLGPGLTNLYVEPNSWMWRVTCSVGAYVREGVEISLHSSKHIETLPYGTVMEVKRKMINVAGLARLRIRAVVDDGKKNSSPRVVEGWISEALNPMSGQDGPIAQPIPFPLPTLYKVTLKAGAVIRSGIELMSTKVGHAPVGSILSVVGRAFSELPQDKCVERLRLAGDGGWISIRLCEDPPEDELIVELVGIDGSFDPPSPGVFHLDAQLRVTEEQSQSSSPQQQQPHVPGVEETRHHDLSDIGSSDSSGCASPQRKKPTVSRLPPPSRQHEQVCLICLTAERNATLIHGEIGHICCCLKCARILKQSGKSCPMCRLPIDLVIQHFYA